jgi:hypothetical protein
MPMGRVSAAIDMLKEKESSMSGDELEALLVDLKFEVRQCGAPGHHVVTHDDLDSFLSTSFDKGHKKQMLACYPRSIRRVLRQYQSQLETILGETDAKA